MELIGRFASVEVPEWEIGDLQQIAERRFSVLNVDCPERYLKASTAHFSGKNCVGRFAMVLVLIHHRSNPLGFLSNTI
jgi:hypothetical protein